MDIEDVRQYCLSFPGATEDIQWGNDLLFRVGGKMFTVVELDALAKGRLFFKCTPEKYAELIERSGVFPAAYTARYHWVALRTFDALDESEIKELIKKSYEMIFAKLSKKVKDGINQTGPG